MKRIFPLLSAASLLCGAPDESLSAQLAEFPVSSQPTFDPMSLAQPPLSPEEFHPPAPVLEPARKSVFLTVGLSCLIPGLGHAYLGDLETASGLVGSSLGLGWVVASSDPPSVKLTSLVTLQSAWSYSLYAAYRDVRKYNGQRGYSYKMPSDSLTDLALAPFRFKVLKKPEVWGGFLGAFAVAAATAYLAYPKEARIPLHLSRRIHVPAIALPIGIGEESLFRGYLQSLLAEAFGPEVGIALSSLTFGAAHIPNAMALAPEHQWRYYAFSLPLVTAMGAYFGWITHKNHSIQESVALHTWYDFVLFSLASLASQASCVGNSSFSIAIPF